MNTLNNVIICCELSHNNKFDLTVINIRREQESLVNKHFSVEILTIVTSLHHNIFFTLFSCCTIKLHYTQQSSVTFHNFVLHTSEVLHHSNKNSNKEMNFIFTCSFFFLMWLHRYSFFIHPCNSRNFWNIKMCYFRPFGEEKENVENGVDSLGYVQPEKILILTHSTFFTLDVM